MGAKAVGRPGRNCVLVSGSATAQLPFLQLPGNCRLLSPSKAWVESSAGLAPPGKFLVNRLWRGLLLSACSGSPLLQPILLPCCSWNQFTLPLRAAGARCSDCGGDCSRGDSVWLGVLQDASALQFSGWAPLRGARGSAVGPRACSQAVPQALWLPVLITWRGGVSSFPASLRS